MTTTLTSTKYKGIKNSEIKYMDAFRTYFFLVIGAFLMIIPLIWMLFSALKTPAQFLTTQLSLAMPENPQWKNFTQRVWEMNPKLQLGILNSIIISFSTSIVGSFVSSLAAFAYSKLHFPG